MDNLSFVYVARSPIEGKGLFCSKDINTGEYICVLSTVYSNSHFKDTPLGRYINHSEHNNVDLHVIKDTSNRIIYVYGISNKYIPKGTELTANYRDNHAPKPNFITSASYNFNYKITH